MSKPYCTSCQKHINPNVVSVSESGGFGGGIIGPSGQVLFRPPSQTTKLVRVCPFCGGVVHTEADRIEQEQREKADADATLFVVGFIAICALPTVLYLLFK